MTNLKPVNIKRFICFVADYGLLIEKFDIDTGEVWVSSPALSDETICELYEERLVAER